MTSQGDPADADAVDPIEFLRRALAISPEDAADVRKTAGMTAEQRAAYERWKAADARVASFAATTPITDVPPADWSAEKAAEYQAAIAELDAAKAALRGPSADHEDGVGGA